MSGILLQLPTPAHIDGSRLTTLIDAAKDVDGLTPVSAGLLAKGLPGLRPCTPAGVIELLKRHDVELEGAEAVVVGRSDLVGKPVAALLLAENATVTMCHSRTRDLGEVCRRADVLIAAVGRPKMVQGDWIKPGATVIDVGINRTDDGLVGDVDFDAAPGGGGADHPGPGRRRPDDDRDVARQYAAGSARSRPGLSGRSNSAALGHRPRVDRRAVVDQLGAARGRASSCRRPLVQPLQPGARSRRSPAFGRSPPRRRR